MKTVSIVLTLVLTLSFLGCRDRQLKPDVLNQIQGVWVSYGYIETNGSLSESSSIMSSNIFGVYAGGFKVYDHNNFYPVGGINLVVKDTEGGKVDYDASQQKLAFNGLFKTECFIQKLESDDLWLRFEGQGGTAVLALRRHK